MCVAGTGDVRSEFPYGASRVGFPERGRALALRAWSRSAAVAHFCEKCAQSFGGVVGQSCCLPVEGIPGVSVIAQPGLQQARHAQFAQQVCVAEAGGQDRLCYISRP